MPVIGAQAEKQAKRPGGRAGHTAHHQPGCSASHAIIDPDIGRPRGGQNVRRDCHHPHPGFGQLPDRVPGNRVIHRDQPDAAGLQRGLFDGFDQRLRRQAVEWVNGAGRNQRQMGREIADRVGKIVHELAASKRNEELQMGRP